MTGKITTTYELAILKYIAVQERTSKEIYQIYFDLISYDRDIAFHKARDRCGHMLHQFKQQELVKRYRYHDNKNKGMWLYILNDKGKDYLKSLQGI